jgi:hypothetical protein
MKNSFTSEMKFLIILTIQCGVLAWGFYRIANVRGDIPPGSALVYVALASIVVGVCWWLWDSDNDKMA